VRQPTEKEKAEFWRRLGQNNPEIPITLDKLFQLGLPRVYMESHEERTEEILNNWIDEVVLHTDFKKAAVRLFWLIDVETR